MLRASGGPGGSRFRRRPLSVGQQCRVFVSTNVGDLSMTQAQRDFAGGRSTQIPVNTVLKIKGRFARKLRYGASELVIDR